MKRSSVIGLLVLLLSSSLVQAGDGLEVADGQEHQGAALVAAGVFHQLRARRPVRQQTEIGQDLIRSQGSGGGLDADG